MTHGLALTLETGSWDFDPDESLQPSCTWSPLRIHPSPRPPTSITGASGHPEACLDEPQWVWRTLVVPTATRQWVV